MDTDTQLQTLYRILDIHVNDLSSKQATFSSKTQESTLTPVPVSEKESSLEKDKAYRLHLKKDVRFATHDDSSVFAYESHPTIDRVSADVVKKCSGCDNRMCDEGCEVPPAKWSIPTHLYIGSITVIGLYAIFRALQKSA